MARTGIYKIFNITSGKIYIGSATNFESRKRVHLHQLRNGIHGNDKLQKSFSKHGEQVFDIALIEECAKEDLIKREQFHIDRLNPFFNICQVAGSNIGIKRSASFVEKQKLLKNRKGKLLNAEQKKTLSEAKQLYYKNNPERAQALRNMAIGNTYRKGCKLSIETRMKMTESRPNKKISTEQVSEIRELFKPFDRCYSARALAKIYGVSHQLISKIVNNKERNLA